MKPNTQCTVTPAKGPAHLSCTEQNNYSRGPGYPSQGQGLIQTTYRLTFFHFEAQRSPSVSFVAWWLQSPILFRNVETISFYAAPIIIGSASRLVSEECLGQGPIIPRSWTQTSTVLRGWESVPGLGRAFRLRRVHTCTRGKHKGTAVSEGFSLRT